MDKTKEVLHINGNFIEGQQQSKEWITLSLLYLMETKAYSDIKVTEIAKKSGLARQTIYRNYEDKDDILYDYLCHQFNFFDDRIKERQLAEADVLIAFFEMWKEFLPASLLYNIQLSDRKIRQIIYRSLEYFVQYKYTAYFIAPQASIGEMHYYVFRSLSSALHGILIEWSLQHYEQSPEQIGKLTYQLTDSIRQYCIEHTIP
ncbi:TetR/AcrR family transcriptional regulator [Paenibacillus sp. 1011MAR3C5]|uniref:TetR/AcrR family transcriptional regulator n=1 Tax=Paenibacillus sp. 1011MAR3C5 TaxID=1675787 RepID=UPI000E6BB8EA|nr:TetR/AcrR family transcriptional regulator [Paenibacillus sp. 1011MAR3C5]RJE89624.1 TetR/AcrR family transcriptional regulator [Paenibacillus sp. 1011MAR3C5]